MKPIEFSAREFSSLSTDPPAFDFGAYSRLKFGADEPARDFGHELAVAFFSKHGLYAMTQPCVVIPAPSTEVPVAATLLAKYFVQALNRLLVQHDSTYFVETSHIVRGESYVNNYADLPKAERQKLLADDVRYVNWEQLGDKRLIFIDDVTITGTHQEKLEQMLVGRFNPRAYVTYARYTGDDASIEHRLNHVLVKEAVDLDWLCSEPGYRVTTRAVRLLLEANPMTMFYLCEVLPLPVLEEFYHSAVIKNYYRHAPYRPAFAQLSKALITRQALKDLEHGTRQKTIAA